MPANRCSTCLVNYKTEVRQCPACGAVTWYSATDEPAEADAPGLGDRVYGVDVDARIVEWRVKSLTRAGIEPLHATALAVRRDVDLHEAVRLAESGCPSHLVGAILL